MSRRSRRPLALTTVSVPLLLLAAALALTLSLAISAAATASAASEHAFVLPTRPSRPSAGLLAHTPIAVAADDGHSESGDAQSARAASGQTDSSGSSSSGRAARSDQTDGAAAAAASTPPGMAATANRSDSDSDTAAARRPSRRFRHSAIVAPSGRTVTAKEAWAEAAATRRAHRQRAAGGSARGANAAGRSAADSNTADADADAEPLPFTAANFSLPFNDSAALHSHADLLAADGFTVLHYDVTLSERARVMDDDLNVLAVECSLRSATAAHPNATLALRLTVTDAAAALIEYSPGAAVHGSQMWNCRNETILGTVDSAEITGPHSVSLLLSRAGYEKIFDRAEILFQQPTVNTADAEAEAEQQQQQPQSNPDSSAPASAAAGGGPMRRMLALPPSTGSLPFDFPESITAEPEATRSGAVPESRQRSPARSRDREFRNLAINYGNSDLLTELLLPPGLVTPSSVVTLRVKSTETVKNSKWYVTLRRYHPVSTNSDFGTFSVVRSDCTANAWCELSIRLDWWSAKGVQPSVFGYYFEVEYTYSCSTWNPFDSDECDESAATDKFWLPVTSSGSLLGDGKGNPAVSAFSRSCSDLSCATASLISLDGVMCKVCSPTRSVSVKLLCDGCKVDYSATISKLTMDYSVLNLFFKTEVVADARVQVKMAATASVELSVKATPQFNLIKDLYLPILPYGISVAGVSLGLVASFSLDGHAQLDFQGSATVNARATLVANMQGAVKYNTDASPRTTYPGSTPTVTHTESPTVSISAAAQVGMEIMLRPSIKIAVSHVAYVALSADTFLRVDGSFQYPPFPALSTPYQLPSAPRALTNFGSCTTPHLLRYGVTAGVRDVALTAAIDIDIASSISSLLSDFDYKNVFPSLVLLPLLQLQIVSGCLLPMSAATPGLDQKLELRSPTAMADIERSALAFNLAMDISAALGIDVSRVRVQLLDGNKQPLGHVVHHTMALPRGDETHGREMRTLATSEVTAATVTVVSPATGASGVSAAAATQSLREQLALPSSTLSKAVAASKFVPPVTYAWSAVVWGACSCTMSAQSGTTACTGSDGSPTTVLELCGVQPATSQPCSPTNGCDASGGGGGGAGGASSDSDSGSSGSPVLWIGVGVGGGVALIALLAVLFYFFYFKPRHSASSVSVKAAAPIATVRVQSKKKKASPQLAQNRVADMQGQTAMGIVPSAPSFQQAQWLVQAPTAPFALGQQGQMPVMATMGGMQQQPGASWPQMQPVPLHSSPLPLYGGCHPGAFPAPLQGQSAPLEPQMRLEQI